MNPKDPNTDSTRSRTQDWIWDKLDLHLKNKSLKQTKQRQEIIEVFLRLNTHLSVEELHQQLKTQGLNIGLATVYRTLSLLKEAGIAQQKQFADGRAVYEVAYPDSHHDHLICLDCGFVIEFENNEIEALQEKIARKHKFRLSSHTLDLYGHCLNTHCEHRNPEKG